MTSEASGPKETLLASEVLHLLSESALLAKLPPQALVALANATEQRTLRTGEALVQDEAPMHTLWIVASGRLTPSKATGPCGMMHATAGEAIDASAAVLGGTHEATWVADDGTHTLGIPVTLFQSFEQLFPAQWADMAEEASTTVLGNALRLALRMALPCCDVNTMLRRAFSDGLWWHMARGEALFCEGDALDAWYVLVSGELAESSTGLGDSLIHCTLRAGDLVGDTEMLAGKVYTSTVVARRDAWLLRLGPDDFEAHVLMHPRAVQQVARRAIQRANDGRKSANLDATVTLIPSGNEQIDQPFINDLITQLRILGPLAVLDAQQCASLGIVRNLASRPRADLAWLRLEAWMDAQHQRQRRILLIGEAQNTAWNLQIARAADRVLLMADALKPAAAQPPAAWQAVQADAKHGLSPSKGDANRWRPQNWLCLIHPADCKRPQSTALWLDRYQPGRHFHARLGLQSDMARLARHLAGQAIGLALSGGGGRGPAHAGVFRAFQESQLPIDFVVGTSAGGLMACLLSQDDGWQNCARRAIEGIGPAPGPFSDLTIPVVSLVKSQRLHDSVRQTYGDERLEDSWIPCATVATNLTRLKRMVYERGFSWQVTLAGISPPGVAKPRVIDGDLICDGGLIDNLPVSVLLEYGCGHTISVDISADQTLHLDKEDFPSAWTILADRLFRGGRHTANVPTSIDILLAATTLASADARAAAADWTDLQIAPNLKRFKSTDFMRGHELVVQGYEDAKAALANHAQRYPHALLWVLLNRYRDDSSHTANHAPFQEKLT